jgi:hypothetical protein
MVINAQNQNQDAFKKKGPPGTSMEEVSIRDLAADPVLKLAEVLS